MGKKENIQKESKITHKATREFVTRREGRSRWDGNSPYHPSYCDILYEIMSEGGSIWEVAKELDVSCRVLYDWKNRHPEFAETFERAKDHSLAFYAKQCFDNVYNKDFNEKVWRNNVNYRHKGALDANRTIFVKSYSESLKDIVNPEVIEKITSQEEN